MNGNNGGGRRGRRRAGPNGGPTLGAGLCALLICLAQAAAAGDFEGALAAFRRGDDAQARASLQALAEAGLDAAQNLYGVFLFKGLGGPRDTAGAHHWFHAAAEEGNAEAWRNLAVFHDLPENAEHRDYTEANAALAMREALLRDEVRLAPAGAASAGPRAEEGADGGRPAGLGAGSNDAELASGLGRRDFISFCSGCHGRDGFAAYPAAPSFARGERFYKDDSELLESIYGGKGGMPPWEDKLSRDRLARALAYMRTLPLRQETGLPAAKPSSGQYIFRFQPFAAGDTPYPFDD